MNFKQFLSETLINGCTSCPSDAEARFLFTELISEMRNLSDDQRHLCNAALLPKEAVDDSLHLGSNPKYRNYPNIFYVFESDSGLRKFGITANIQDRIAAAKHFKEPWFKTELWHLIIPTRQEAFIVEGVMKFGSGRQYRLADETVFELSGAHSNEIINPAKELCRFTQLVERYRYHVENYRANYLEFVKRYLSLYRTAADAIASIVNGGPCVCSYNIDLDGRMCLFEEQYSHQEHLFVNWKLWKEAFPDYLEGLRSKGYQSC